MRGAWIYVNGERRVIASVIISSNPDPVGAREENILEALIRFPEAFARTDIKTFDQRQQSAGFAVKPEPMFAPQERFLLTCRALAAALIRGERGLADDQDFPRDQRLEDEIGATVIRHHGLAGIERMFGK